MRDASSSYFHEAQYPAAHTRQSRHPGRPGPMPGFKPAPFRPLHWLRLTLFGSHDGTTLVPASTSPPVVESRGQALREAHRSLHALIKKHPGLKQMMPHLAHIERALGRKGSRALMRIPVAVLQRGLEQLEGLQAEQPRDALRALRTRLVEAIALRSVARNTALASPRTAQAAVEVTEASQSEFDEVERSWTSPAPLHTRDWA